MTYVLLTIAVLCWWRGHHLPAAGAALIAIDRIWPPFSHHLAVAVRWAADTQIGSAVVLYGLTLAIPVCALAYWNGRRPRYRTFAQPRAARRAQSHASSWVIRDTDRRDGAS